jgi:SAM-dependent methyltransferase
MIMSSRSFLEYRAMFALVERDLDGVVLDCAGGASGFVAEAGAMGVRALAADPLYAHGAAVPAERLPADLVAACLPHLPLADGSVDLVLCSHLLFTWADRLDQEWHRTAIMEMSRVSRREVRIFPLVRMGDRADRRQAPLTCSKGEGDALTSAAWTPWRPRRRCPSP